jgi:hypothetical protein
MASGPPTPPGKGADAGAAAGEKQGCEQPCKACVPPLGTIAYRLDLVPPSKPHKPLTGTHWHLYKMNQIPKNCDCFWQSLKIVGEGPPPPGTVPITKAAGGGR